MFRKSHSWKRNPASFLLLPNHQLWDLRECLAWVCTSASTFWPCILSIQHGCRGAVASHAQSVESGTCLGTPICTLPCVGSPSTATTWKVWGSELKHHPLALAEISRLGWDFVLVWLCSPVSSAYLGTAAQGQAGTSPAGRARHSGWGTRGAWSCPCCLGLC